MPSASAAPAWASPVGKHQEPIVFATTSPAAGAGSPDAIAETGLRDGEAFPLALSDAYGRDAVQSRIAIEPQPELPPADLAQAKPVAPPSLTGIALLEDPALIEPEPEPQQEEAAPDPVPAGLTALSSNMQPGFEAVPPKPATPSLSDTLAPIAPEPAAVELPAGLDTKAVLASGAFELRDGALHPLTLPDFAPPATAEIPLPEWDSQWTPLADAPAPHARLSSRELDFDPQLLELLEDQEERDRELKAIDSVGLAGACEIDPFARWQQQGRYRAAAPAAREAFGYDEFAADAAAFSERLDAAVLPDAELHEACQNWLREQRENEALDAAAARFGPLLVRVREIERIPFRSPEEAAVPEPLVQARGYAPWPPAGPYGRPVRHVEFEFDPEVLNRVHEWEELEAAADAPAVVPEFSEVPEPEFVAAAAYAEPVEASAVVEEEIAAEAPVATPVAAPVAAEPEPVTEQSLVVLSQQLTTTGNAAASQQQDSAAPVEEVIEILNPIVEAPMPPIARMTRLPDFELKPAGTKVRPRQSAPQPQFTPREPLVPAVGGLIKIIPSPIMNIQHNKLAAPPGWLVTAAIALLIPITALGVVNYWILPAQRATAAAPATAGGGSSSAPASGQAAAAAATAASATGKPATGVPDPAAGIAAWQKQLELAGLRMQNSTVKCLIINHSKADSPALNLLVTLRSARGGDPPVGTFRVRLSPLASGNAREIAEPISFVPPMRPNVDWSDLKAEIQVSKP